MCFQACKLPPDPGWCSHLCRNGNRLTESRGTETDTYNYLGNATGGRNPKLLSVAAGGGGTRSYGYDQIGHTIQVVDDEQQLDLIPDAAGRMAFLRSLPEENVPMTATVLAERVRRSFRDVPAPSKIAFLPEDEDFESALVANAFRDKHWRDLTPQFLQSRPEAMAFFSPEAFRYFLPGYLLLALKDLSSLDVSLISLLSALAGPAQHEELLGILSEAQLLTVLAVLDAITPEEAHPMYWDFEQAKQGVLEHLTRP